MGGLSQMSIFFADANGQADTKHNLSLIEPKITQEQRAEK